MAPSRRRVTWSSAAQVAALQRRPHIVVATPGRLLDLAGDGEIDLGAPHIPSP